jgi:hypothetical protein
MPKMAKIRGKYVLASDFSILRGGKLSVFITNSKVKEIYVCVRARSLFPYPRQQLVEPANGEAEPTVFCHGLATEAEDELAERIVGIRQSGIEEVDVGIVMLPRPGDGLPHGHHRGMKPRIALTEGSEIPQIGVALGIDTDATTDQTPFVERGEEATVVAAIDLSDLLLRRHDTMHFPPVEAPHQMDKAVEVLLCGHLTRLYSLLVDMLYLFQHLRLQTVVGIHGVERVVDFLPGNREEALGTEILVAKHLAGDIAELDEEAQPTTKAPDKRFEKQTKDFLTVHVIGIVTLAIGVSLPVEQRHPRGTQQKDEDMADHPTLLVGSHSHTRPLTRSALNDMEELRAMEEVAVVHGRQCVSTCIDCGLILRHCERMFAYWQN